MTPWTFLAWMFITVLYAVCWAAFWFVSRYYGWRVTEGRLITLAVAVPVVCLLLIALVKSLARVAHRPRRAPPAQQFAAGWNDLAHLLGPQPRPVFLAVGEEDEYRRRIWLGRKNCRYLLDDASGLAMIVFPECLWLDVPSAYLDLPKGFDNPAAIPTGNGAWEELAAFIPRLPGPFAGAAVFVDSEQEDPAWEAKLRWLGKKLAVLFHRQKTAAPWLWLVGTRFEDSPAGRRLIPVIGAESGEPVPGSDAACMSAVSSLAEILGGTTPRAGMEPGHAAARHCLDAMRAGIDEALSACDAAVQDCGPVRGLVLLRQDVDRLGARLGGALEILNESLRQCGTRLGGLSLCGLDHASGCLAFTAKLIADHIPALARIGGRRRFAWKLPALATALVAAAGLAVGFGYIRSEGVIDALPVALLERPPQTGGFGGPPPVARYARARRILTELEERVLDGPARPFSAPRRGVAAVEAMFTENLRSWLPEPGNPYAEEPWLDGLLAWSELEASAKPIRFRTPAGRELASLPGRYTRPSRAAAFSLLGEWGRYLEDADRAVLEGLKSKFDAAVIAAWQAAGEALALRVGELASEDLATARDVITANAGVNFIERAGEELWRTTPPSASTPWLEAVLAARQMMAVSAALNNEGVSVASLPALGDAASTVWKDEEPPRRFDMVRRVAEQWRRYRDILFMLHPSAQSDDGMAELAAQCYGGRDAEPGLTGLHDAWTVLAAGLIDADAVFSAPGGESVLTLLGQGEFLFMETAVRAAAEGVQRDWEDKLLAMPVDRRDGVTLEEGILVDAALETFLAGAAKPYLAVWRGLRLPKQALGTPFPWTDEFIAWLQRWERVSLAARRDYPVRIRILPVTVNRGASAFPRGLTFSVACADKPVQATMYNYGNVVAFRWNPKQCAGVTVTVHFDDYDLVQVFPGPMGFADFLHTLKGGRLEFAAQDFPERADRLAKCGIEGVYAAFTIDGGEGILALGGRPPPPPARVVP
ncbi:MAG: hypothetical protein LUE17_11900 [Planctomycetaceae bacterium]|nr:hypothetical protein [Planctomycetaceae bacterium]